MKISLLKTIPLLLSSIALTAQAVPIAGQINIQSGTVVLTPNQLGAVTAVGPSANGVVTSVEGSYPMSLIGDAVTHKSFLVTMGSQPITSLWTATDVVGTGFSFSFDLGSITSVTQSSSLLSLTGTGTLQSTNPGLDPTPGLWTYGINSADGTPTNGVFSFQSNNVGAPIPTGVPDGGDAVILVGVGLLTIGGLARRFSWAG